MEKTDFYKYATGKLGMSGNALNDYMNFTNHGSGYINPSIIEERKLNVAQMDVFSRLMMDRIIFLGTEIDEYTANVVQGQMLYLASTEPDKDITLYLNSPGGIVSGGLAIYDTMNYISCDVSTVVTGMAASMAAVLLAAGTKGKRYALPHSRVMIHQPLGGTQGQASDMEIAVNEIRKLKDELYNILHDSTGQSLKQITKDCERDHYMTSKEALDYGMIDRIFQSKKKK